MASQRWLCSDSRIYRYVTLHEKKDFAYVIGIGNNFLSRTQMAQQLKERINKWDYRKLSNFCTSKEMVSK
jgi:hypothetical protein